MNNQAQQRLRRNLDSATDETLVVLANRGLVRRAAKDLLQSQLQLAIQDDAIEVQGSDWIVRMPPEGPAAATDDTQASGMTRQILAATMFLRDSWQPAYGDSQPATEHENGQGAAAENAGNSIQPRAEESGGSSVEPADEPMGFSATIQLLTSAATKDLAKWSGQTPVMEANSMFSRAGEATIQQETQLSVSFPEADVRVVLMTDIPAKTLRKLLDQFRSSAPKEEHACWVLMAVLALKQAAGVSTQLDTNSSTLPEAVKDDRKRVARKVGSLIRAAAATGVAHPSTRMVERFRTASVAAEAARFTRLARQLAAIADETSMQLARHVAADPIRSARRLIIAYALAEAASHRSNENHTELFGKFRSTYTNVGELELCGLGAYGWRTASGFEGVTAVFWEEHGQQFLTASNARSEQQDRTFSVRDAYRRSLGWRGAGAISEVCRCRISLTNAKQNPVGRLSTAESCAASVGEAIDFESINFGDRVVSEWSQLTAVLETSEPLGLRQPDPRSSIVIIRPSEWSDRWFDELHQTFVWRLKDKSGATLQLRVPWTTIHERSIVFMENIKVAREKPVAVLGRISIVETGMSLYPISILSPGTPKGDTVLCPQFDEDRIRSENASLLKRLRRKFGRVTEVETKIGPDDDALDPHNDYCHFPARIRETVDAVAHILTASLESGARQLSPDVIETLQLHQRQLSKIGIAPLADSLNEIASQPNRTPHAVLHASYRLLLCRQASRLSASKLA